MSLVVLNITCDRISAVSAGRGQHARPLALLDDELAVPLAVKWESGVMQVGRAALEECRIAPHRVCTGFLPRIGEACGYQLDGMRLGPTDALRHVLKAIRPALSHADGILLMIPSYLRRDQASALGELLRESGMPLLGAVRRAAAWAAASYAEHAWHNLGIVVDVDGHALTLTMLRPNESEIQELEQRVMPELSLRIWKEKLLAQVAEQCVQLCRRDPRESAEADQRLYDQVEAMLEAAGQGRAVPVRIVGDRWFQRLVVQPGDAVAACRVLTQLVGRELQSALRFADKQLSTASILLTPDSARLPGLAAEIYHQGENKLPVSVLSNAAADSVAMELAQRIARGEIPPGMLSPTTPLPYSEELATFDDAPTTSRHAMPIGNP